MAVLGELDQAQQLVHALPHTGLGHLPDLQPKATFLATLICLKAA